MNAIVIGADRLGNIPELLSDWNINITRHITGRHAADQRKPHGPAQEYTAFDIIYRFSGT